MTYDEAISQLPDTSAKIAQFLLERGFKGCRQNNESCPIANYLFKECEGQEFPKRGYDRVFVWGIRNGDIQAIDGYFPKHISQFIKEFDEGSYDELQDKDEDKDDERRYFV